MSKVHKIKIIENPISKYLVKNRKKET